MHRTTHHRPRSIMAAVVALCGLGLLVAAAARPLASGGADVAIRNRQFAPASVRIKAGETVTWSNEDDFDHSLVAADGSFASGVLKSGSSFRQRFPTRGSFAYGCRLHPRERGVVVVE